MSVAGKEIFNRSEGGLSMLFSGGEIKIKERHSQSGYGIRVISGGKVGFSYCDNAKDMAKTAEQAKLLCLLEAKNFSFQKRAKYEKMNLVDRKITDCAGADAREIIYQIKGGIEKFAKQCRISLEVGSAKVAIENNFGLREKYEKTSISAYSEATIGDGLGYSYLSSSFMPKDFVALGEQAGQMAKDMRKAKKLPNGKYTVALELEALQSMLEILMPSFSGDWKRKKISSIAGKKGRRIFDECFMLYADGRADASGKAPFDDEGVPTKRTPLVENGVAKNFLYDNETAALDDAKSTSSCIRSSYSSYPAIGALNIVIEPGKGNKEKRFGKFEDELKELVLVRSLHGTHTSNMTTGDFGVEVNAGMHYKNGRQTAVRGFVISGNIFNLFNSIQGMEKGAGVFDNLISPRIAFSGVQVVG